MVPVEIVKKLHFMSKNQSLLHVVIFKKAPKMFKKTKKWSKKKKVKNAMGKLSKTMQFLCQIDNNNWKSEIRTYFAAQYWV